MQTAHKIDFNKGIIPHGDGLLEGCGMASAGTVEPHLSLPRVLLLRLVAAGDDTCGAGGGKQYFRRVHHDRRTCTDGPHL
jgi:hypothetical protein